jgi:hypothetical protein
VFDPTFDFVYNEDSAFNNNDLGAYVLAVRQDTLATDTSLSGDFASFKVNAEGALWVAPVGNIADDGIDAGNPIKIGSRSKWGTLNAVSTDADRADLISDKYRRIYVNNGANISIKPNAVSVTSTATALPTTALAGRRQILVQNLHNKPIYIGDSAVAVGDGLRVAAGATVTLEAGQDVVIYAIADSGVTAPCRVLELA